MFDPLDEHLGDLSDSVKFERYERAIGRLIRREHVVLDLGCRSGVLGLLALRAGAEDRLDRPPAFLPVEKRASVSAGQRIKAAIMARPHDHVISWRVSLTDLGQQVERSTFDSLFIDNARRIMLEGKAKK